MPSRLDSILPPSSASAKAAQTGPTADEARQDKGRRAAGPFRLIQKNALFYSRLANGARRHALGLAKA